MSLNQKAIDELKNIHLDEFGEELTDQEAWDIGISLVNLFKALCKNTDQKGKGSQDVLTE